jgi:integrase
VKRQLLEVNPLSEMSGHDFGIKKQMGERTLDRKELALVWRAIEDSRLIERNKILYKLSLFWACRVGELRQAEVSHFDFEEGIWTFHGKTIKRAATLKSHWCAPSFRKCPVNQARY